MDNKSTIVNALKQSILFQGLDDKAFDFVSSKAKLRQFFPEETIVWQGKPSDSLFVIINGIVAVKKIVGTGDPHILAYLMPGLTFGEVGILDNQPRSATVSALSDVDVLVIRREDFMVILHQYPTVAVELAKMLGRYLVETSRRQSMGNKKAKLILFFNLSDGVGATTFGSFLSATLAQKTEKSTVYVEYPNPQNIINDLQLQKNTRVFKHPSGFDILTSQEQQLIPTTARTTLMLDQIMNSYNNIVVSLPGVIDETIRMMLDYAKQIIILTPPEEKLWGNVEKIQQELKDHIRPYETSVFTVINRNKEDYNKIDFKQTSDFDVPYFPNLPNIKDFVDPETDMPPPVFQVIETFVDRLERTNQLSVFIPSTLDVDQKIDTSHYVKQTLDFLGERFGGATSKEAEGVWNSDEVGLVGETVFIVHTYATQGDLNKHLDAVVEYIEKLKVELKQEAMALEVNQKLTLI